ncbi:hypothetical protein BJ968_004136 [Kineococcus aurantiacus]|uniref:Uncharacterized protein n=1 Tax=Kineococcus aurantiacus TaxID=37633 RepID=A0A7Y9DPU6_9ACTN|nr:hypothetical protein [Kineococcus aurantiacus]
MLSCLALVVAGFVAALRMEAAWFGPGPTTAARPPAVPGPREEAVPQGVPAP